MNIKDPAHVWLIMEISEQSSMHYGNIRTIQHALWKYQNNPACIMEISEQSSMHYGNIRTIQHASKACKAQGLSEQPQKQRIALDDSQQ